MIARYLALLVALIFFWSGLAAQGDPATFATTQTEQQAKVPSMADPLDRIESGSANTLLPDELPAPAQAEAQADLQAIPADGILLRSPSLAMERPRADAAIARLSPDLDGLQRPPRTNALVA